MIIEVTGIWDDGTPHADDAPDGTAFALRLAKGATATIRATVLDPAGIPVDLAGFIAALTIKRGVLLEDVVVHRAGVIMIPTTDGVVDFALSGSDLDVDPGRCAYDVWLTSGTGEKQQVVALSPLLLGYAAGP